MWWQLGWIWIVAGVALAVLEVLAPGYVFLGFAVGAAVVGVLLWLGLMGGGLPMLLLVFALVSLAAWWGMRRVFGIRRGQIKIWDKDINE